MKSEPGAATSRVGAAISCRSPVREFTAGMRSCFDPAHMVSSQGSNSVSGVADGTDGEDKAGKAVESFGGAETISTLLQGLSRLRIGLAALTRKWLLRT